MKRNLVKGWLNSMVKVLAREFSLVLSDAGVLVFFLVLPTIYPIVYTLIYNPEVVRDIPVAVVDDCRTSRSREFVSMADATEAMHIIGYAATLDEARRWQSEKACYGILVIPHDYDRNIGRGEQATVIFYCDMSLLLRYRTFLSALTDLTLATGTQIRQKEYPLTDNDLPVDSRAVMAGDSSQGFASFVIPGILILIIQQSLILGISMLGGGSEERRRRNNGYDPMAIEAPRCAVVMGKALCYSLIYAPLIIYMLWFIPAMFNLPRLGLVTDIALFVVPLLLSSSFLGLCLQRLSTERESSMLVVVFTSVVFIFLSGLTWPRYAMSPLWQVIGSLLPATWGIEGFIGLNSMGATLSEVAYQYIALWVLSLVYFVLAVALTPTNGQNKPEA